MRLLALILTFCALAFEAGHAEQAPASAVPETRTQITLSFAPLVKQVAPAVVNIYTQRKVQQGLSPFFNDPFFNQFFGGGVPQGFTRQRLESALGSGVIVRADGLVVTSNHVIAGADQIRVVLADHREFDATLLLADERTDLAVLHIDAKGAHLPYLELKDSDAAEIGDLVLAIGDPFGVGQTVTSGIISAMAHGAMGSSNLDYYIQTDAAINPGNSGGALVTMDGKLVGINSSIYSKSGGNLGIGFAVPSNVVRIIVNAVESGEKTIIHPWLGIDEQEVTPEIAASMDMAEPKGVLVKKILPSSPAGKAGLQVGDVIVAVGNKTIEDVSAFHYRIDTLAVGATADLGIIRKGQKLDLHIVLIAPPEDPPRDKTEIKGRNPFGGAIIENISPAVVEEMRLAEVDQGVIIVDVMDGTAAANIGLRPGDIILSVNNAKISNVSEIKNIANQQSNRWQLSIQRGDSVMNVVVGE